MNITSLLTLVGIAHAGASVLTFHAFRTASDDPHDLPIMHTKILPQPLALAAVELGLRFDGYRAGVRGKSWPRFAFTATNPASHARGASFTVPIHATGEGLRAAYRKLNGSCEPQALAAA